jgi:hypothetical protein
VPPTRKGSGDHTSGRGVWLLMPSALLGWEHLPLDIQPQSRGLVLSPSHSPNLESLQTFRKPLSLLCPWPLSPAGPPPSRLEHEQCASWSYSSRYVACQHAKVVSIFSPSKSSCRREHVEENQSGGEVFDFDSFAARAPGSCVCFGLHLRARKARPCVLSERLFLPVVVSFFFSQCPKSGWHSLHSSAYPC